MSYISKKILTQLNLNDFTPGKIIDQLKFIPEIFSFLKSKERQMGRIRPLITYMVGVAIWAFRKQGSLRRTLPQDFFTVFWDRFANDRDRARRLGEIIEKIEPDLWEFFLTIIQGEILRENKLSKEEIGIGALVFATIVIGLFFVFSDEDDLRILNEYIEKI
jgi:hypothetical protein